MISVILLNLIQFPYLKEARQVSYVIKIIPFCDILIVHTFAKKKRLRLESCFSRMVVDNQPDHKKKGTVKVREIHVVVVLTVSPGRTCTTLNGYHDLHQFTRGDHHDSTLDEHDDPASGVRFMGYGSGE